MTNPGVRGHPHDQGTAAVLRYARNAPRSWRSPVNRAVIDRISPRAGERVMDIGAGVGPGALLAAKTGATVIVVEPTPAMYRILSVRRRVARQRDRIEIRVGVAEKLPVPDASIDAIWAVNTMHHWSDAHAAAIEIVRVLRPGGRVLLVDEDFQHPDHRLRHRCGTAGRHHPFDPVDADVVGEQLRGAGLADVAPANTRMRTVPVRLVQGRKPR